MPTPAPGGLSRRGAGGRRPTGTRRWLTPATLALAVAAPPAGSTAARDRAVGPRPLSLRLPGPVHPPNAPPFLIGAGPLLRPAAAARPARGGGVCCSSTGEF
jgi:hypothetical protein